MGLLVMVLNFHNASKHFMTKWVLFCDTFPLFDAITNLLPSQQFATDHVRQRGTVKLHLKWLNCKQNKNLAHFQTQAVKCFENLALHKFYPSNVHKYRLCRVPHKSSKHDASDVTVVSLFDFFIKWQIIGHSNR